jgi:hypothetical protein
MQDIGYGHRQTVHLGSTTPDHESMPGVHRVAMLMKQLRTGLAGMHSLELYGKQKEILSL